MTPETKRSAKTSRGWTTATLLLVAIFAMALAVWGRDNPLTARAESYAETVATTSAATYVTLRTLNAFLSTAQEIEVGGSLFVSGTVQPLKVLEPIDDTIERIAGAIFAVMIATGVLAVALGPVSGIGLTMIALASLIALALRGTDRNIAAGLARYGLFLAVALPLGFVLSAMVADAMTNAVWAEHQRIIAEITRGVADVARSETTGDSGWTAALTASMTSLADYRAFAASIYENADRLVGSFVMILAVFVFKLFVLPALMLGGIFMILRTTGRRRDRDRAGTL